MRIHCFLLIAMMVASLWACSTSSLDSGGQNGVECREDSDCPPDYRCFDTRCREFCESDADCSAGFCDLENNICLPGGSDGDQPQGDGDREKDSETQENVEDGPLCVEDETRCMPNNDLQVQKCQDEQWVFFKSCPPSEPCLDGECNRPVDADEDRQYDPDDDADTAEASEDEGEAEYFCKPGVTRCKNESEVEICEDDEWVDQKSCNEDEICLDGKCLVPPDGDTELELECVCSASDGPCCDGCHYYPSSRKCQDLPSLEGCDFGTDCGSAITERARQRFCDGYSSTCTGNIYTFSSVKKQDCASSQRCSWSPQSGALCSTDASCQCQCSSGPCCLDGCHYSSSLNVCDTTYEEQFYCDPVNPSSPSNMCGSIYKKITKQRYCSGYSNACTGSVVSLSSPEVVQACYSTQVCNEGGGSICVNNASCSWACSEGPCCDSATHSYKLAGTICQSNVGYSYGCEGVSSCGDDYGRWVRHRTCSGYSDQCSGQDILGEFEVVAACQPYQICSAASSGCLNDSLCACTCSNGACCDGCHYKSSATVCAADLAEEKGCPWGQGSGSNVGVRYLQQLCSGSSSSCSGVQKYSDWQIKEDCGADEACMNGECINIEPCTGNADCPAGHYCSNGDCKEHVFPCSSNSNCPPEANMFCNTQYGECMPKGGLCRVSADCAGHADGSYCDSVYGFCYGPQCVTTSANCRPGTICAWASAYVSNGFYCQGCDENSDCSDGMICRRRPWLPGVCIFE